MSLEAKIEELIDVIRELTAALLQVDGVSKEVEPDVLEIKESEAEFAEEHLQPVREEVAPVVKLVKVADAITYDHVKKAILTLSAVSRDVAVNLLKDFEATSGPKLKESDYAAFVEAANVLLSELNNE